MYQSCAHNSCQMVGKLKGSIILNGVIIHLMHTQNVLTFVLLRKMFNSN